MSELLTALSRSSYQSATVTLTVWLVCRLLNRRLPASVRCTLWRLTYVKLLLGLVIAGGIALPLLRTTAPLQDKVSHGYAAIQPMQRPVVATPQKASIPPATAAVVPTIAVVKIERSPNWPNCLGVAYFTGLAICLSRLVFGWTRARRLLRTAAPIEDARCLAQLAELSAGIGLRIAPRLAAQVDIPGPTYISGIILLPAGCPYERDALRLILAHELAHARRRDLVYEWLGVATQTLFYFHPLVHLARREERLARESAADALALRATALPAATLGAVLLELAANPKRAPRLVGTIGVFASGALLHRRLIALREARTMETHRGMILLPLGAVLLALIPFRLTNALGQPPTVVPPAVRKVAHSRAVRDEFFPRIPFGQHMIVGRVHDDQGRPVGDILINFTLIRQGEFWPEGPFQKRRATTMVRTDAAGNYTLNNVPDGHYGVETMDGSILDNDPAHRSNRSLVGRFTFTLSETTIKPEEHKKGFDLLASRGVTVSGRVLDQKSGRPLSNVKVFGAQEDAHGIRTLGVDMSKTDAEGHYFLRLHAGRVSAVVMFPDVKYGQGPEKKFQLSLGQSATYDFRVTPSAPPSS